MEGCATEQLPNAAAEGPKQTRYGKNEATVNPEMRIVDDGHKCGEEKKFSRGSERICELMFYLLWQMCLVSPPIQTFFQQTWI